MALVLASAALTDEEFLAAVTSAQLPPSRFRHADHLRLAWLCVHRAPLREAEQLVRDAIRNFAERNGAGHIYHETITLAWVRLLATHTEPSFSTFLKENESRLNRELLHRFWSPEVLRSDLAKREWVPPDQCSLPTPHPPRAFK